MKEVLSRISKGMELFVSNNGRKIAVKICRITLCKIQWSLMIATDEYSGFAK